MSEYQIKTTQFKCPITKRIRWSASAITASGICEYRVDASSEQGALTMLKTKMFWHYIAD